MGDNNRITRLFETKPSGILSVYFTAGFPQLHDTLPVLRALQEGGVDMVEIGIPFSDPMADGPVIQASSTQSLRNGMSVHLLLEQLKGVRQEITIPLILMGYLNPVMQYGIENFLRDAADVGVDGLILPDLPFDEYLSVWEKPTKTHALKMIMLITPETSEARIRLIDAHTDGFIYMVSSASTTGAQERFDEDRLAYFRRIDAMKLRNPRLVGFGISNAETFAAAATSSSGAIVGSKFVDILSTSTSASLAVKQLLSLLNVRKQGV
jgi:tryptophan synthase alpha chain